MKQREIEHLLPGIYQRTVFPGSPLNALLSVMEALHEPDEAVLDNLESYFNAYATPDGFVPYLASWVDLDRLLIDSADDEPDRIFPTGQGRLRELIASAVYLSRWRGTARGLLRFLETATGVQGFQIIETVPDEDGQPIPFHLHVIAPSVTSPYRPLLERIIDQEKPAYVTFELSFA